MPIVTNLPKTSVLGKKILENNCGFCYDENNIKNFINIINNFRDNKRLLKIMSDNAKTLYKREFVAEKVYKNMCNHLEKIVKNV